MEDKNFCCYEFGEFRLDTRKRALSKNGEKISLSARNFDLLLFMIENGGRILEHDELLDKVWAGTFVEQATLKKGVSALRQILDGSEEDEFIKTIPRRGYSFVSPVRVIPEENGESFFVRETEREIIVEEFEETDEPPKEVIEISAGQTGQLPAMVTKTSVWPRALLFAGVGVGLLLAAFLAFRFFSVKSAQTQFSAENVRLTRITNNGKILGGAAASADGNYILYPTAEKDGVVLWVRQINANSASRLTMPTPGSFWAFGIAPDNSYIYYIFNNVAEPSKSGMYKIPMLGGEPQRIAENVASFAISPDGKQIAVVRFYDNTTIALVGQNGENERPVVVLPNTVRLWSLGWTPDGKSLLCAIRKTVEGKFLYYVSEFSVETGAETVVLPAQEKIVFGASWLPDKGSLLLVVRESNSDIRQIWQYFPAGEEWRRVTNDNNSYKLINLTRDGKTIITTQESRLAAIWLADAPLPDAPAAGKKSPMIGRDSFHQITDSISNFDRIGWLADGHLMYSMNESGREAVFTINADGTNARQITSGEDGIWIAPSVSGNGRNVSFLSTREGSKQVWRIDADGKNPAKLTDADSFVMSAHILRDNSSLIYAVYKGDDVVLVKQTADGQKRQLTEVDTGFWAVSPDEKLLAAVLLDKNTKKYHVEVRNLDDGKTLKTFEIMPKRQIVFTPDGKNLAYDVANADVSQIMIQPLDGEAYQLTDFQMDMVFNFGWSADGKRLAVIRGRQLIDAVQLKVEPRN